MVIRLILEVMNSRIAERSAKWREVIEPRGGGAGIQAQVFWLRSH